MLAASGRRSHTAERCAICKSFSEKLQRVRDSHLKMLLFEKSMCLSFDPELPWAETSELPFWKNTSPLSFTQLSNVLMVKFILCSGKTSSDKGKKECKPQRQKRQGSSFPSPLQYRVHKSSQFLQIKVIWDPKMVLLTLMQGLNTIPRAVYRVRQRWPDLTIGAPHHWDASSPHPAGSALVVETSQLAEDLLFPWSLTGLPNCRGSVLVVQNTRSP